MMSLLSVVILTYTLDDDIHQMNIRCIESLLDSERWNNGQLDILLIESNKQNPYTYNERVKVIVPDEVFNFHRFFNIGLSQSKGEFIAFCNNDIVFTKGWFSAIMEIKQKHPEFMCFSPLDRSYPLMSEDFLPSSQDYYIGWKNKQHFAAWCFVWERKVFDIIGPFDETFDFYSADDDELQTLRYYAIPNVVVTHSEVKHISQVVTKKEGAINSHRITNPNDYPLTEEELRRGYAWLWEDERFYSAYQREKKKWGNQQMRRFLTKILYNKRVNIIMSKLTGIKQ